MSARLLLITSWLFGGVALAQINSPPSDPPPPPPGSIFSPSDAGAPPTPEQAPPTAGTGVPPPPLQAPPTSGTGVPGGLNPANPALPPTQPGLPNAPGVIVPGSPMLFSTMDTNGDGIISPPEAVADPAIMARFQNLDTDNDGRLSSIEFNQGRNNPGTPSPVSPDFPQN